MEEAHDNASGASRAAQLQVLVQMPVPPQSVYPKLQKEPQTPPLQVRCPFGGVGQTCPHAPQFKTSLSVARQTPLQRLFPGLQPTPHCEAEHVAKPLAMPGQT